ncbi:hypothetical protein COU61_04615 [Candidatus Pacearchaeota archaeon CG10_big_fil_rev_8_21_14_0_10_35_13]|nr:MAG: hypothetical protein COU61_04615 [Candidatus Pacearchaeota archaeon CG10_big_fil_rev_8_21_14_0_10_35_13]
MGENPRGRILRRNEAKDVRRELDSDESEKITLYVGADETQYPGSPKEKDGYENSFIRAVCTTFVTELNEELRCKENRKAKYPELEIIEKEWVKKKNHLQNRSFRYVILIGDDYYDKYEDNLALVVPEMVKKCVCDTKTDISETVVFLDGGVSDPRKRRIRRRLGFFGKSRVYDFPKGQKIGNLGLRDIELSNGLELIRIADGLARIINKELQNGTLLRALLDPRNTGVLFNGERIPLEYLQLQERVKQKEKITPEELTTMCGAYRT